MAPFWFRFWLKLGRPAVGTIRRPSHGRCHLVLEPLEERVVLNTYTVTNTNDAGTGSLRAAILYADANPSTVIGFNIPGTGVHTIRPTSSLPALLASTTIDGSTQLDYSYTPLIALDGSAAGQVGGLTIFADGCSVKALTVSNFQGYGIGIYTAFNSLQHNVISGNTLNDPNNLASGVLIIGRAAQYNMVQDNYIGTDSSGGRALGNDVGVTVAGDAAHNTIGGEAFGLGNLIAGNRLNGVQLRDGASANAVQGNAIGTNAFGGALPNGSDGVSIFGAAHDNVVGKFNYISGNNGYGVHIDGSGTAHNLVRNNVIGANGLESPLPNAQGGVRIDGGASENTIGGQFATSGNLISGNAGPSGAASGVAIAGQGTSYNAVQGNWIGVDFEGSGALGNDVGVWVHGASFNTIGGTAPGLGNVISGNRSDGVVLDSVGANDNVVQGNLIGTNATATAALPNQANGVVIETGAYANVIGGARTGAGNLIAGNSGEGVILAGGATGNALRGNAIGTDASGTLNLGNSFDGVVVYGTNNLIGGSDPGAGNRIMNNGVDGVRIAGGAGNTIQANTISNNAATGVTIYIRASGNHVWDNEIVANGGIGVRIGEGAGDASSIRNDLRRNAISANGALGIDLAGDGVTPNHVGFLAGPNNFQNYPERLDASSDGTTTTVHGNLNNNDPAAAGKDFTVEFFVNTVPDGSGHGQGEQFLRVQSSPDGSAMVNPDGSATVHTDGAGNTPIFTVVLEGTTPGQYVTATATDPQDNTSEFSADVAITDASSGPATAGGIAAWVLGQRAALPSAPPMALPQAELVTKAPLPPTEGVPFRYGPPDVAAVDDFFSGAKFRSQGALRHEAAAALPTDYAAFLGAGVLASTDW
jgi:parallel beta-helix repeat protein